MSVTISPNMNLPIPSVGSELGPQYALDINAALTLVDQHDHTPGHGIAITPFGMNINTDLTFGGNAAINLRAAVFTPEASVSDIDALYVNGVDFYLNDGNGNTIRLTQSGAIVGTPGSITGLPSGTAGVNFSGGTYTFSEATNTPGNIQAGSISLGNNVALSKYMTLNPPNAMAANFSIQFPSLPGSTQILQLNASGNITAALTVDNASLQISSNLLSIKNNAITNAMLQSNIISASQMQTNSVATAAIQSNAVTRPKLVAVGQQVSGSSGSYGTGSTSPVDVTNLSVTITTTGRPVMLMVQGAYIGVTNGNFDTAALANFRLLRGGIAFTANYALKTAGDTADTNKEIQVPASLTFLDTPAAGTYTYKLQAWAAANCTTSVINCVLIAYEL